MQPKGTISDGKITIEFTSPPNTAATMTGTIDLVKMTLSGVYNGQPLTGELRPASATKYEVDAAKIRKTAEKNLEAEQTQQNQAQAH